MFASLSFLTIFPDTLSCELVNMIGIAFEKMHAYLICLSFCTRISTQHLSNRYCADAAVWLLVVCRDWIVFWAMQWFRF